MTTPNRAATMMRSTTDSAATRPPARALTRLTIGPVALAALLFVVTTGCGSTADGEATEAAGGPADNVWAERSEATPTMGDIDEPFIADLDDELVYYFQAAYVEDKPTHASASRSRIRSRVVRHRQALETALQAGNAEQRRIAGVALGFLSLPDEAIEVIPLMLATVPGRDGDDLPTDGESLGAAHGILVGLAELGAQGALRIYPDRPALIHCLRFFAVCDAPFLRGPAVEALGYAVKPNEALAGPAIETLRARLAEEPEWPIRGKVIGALGNIRAAAGYEAIVAQALWDPRPEVRWDAVTALGDSREPAYVDALITKLEDDSPPVRAQAVTMLVRYGRIQARRTAILTAIRSALADRAPNVRVAALEAISKLSTGTTPVTLDVIAKLGDMRRDVRLAAIVTLGILENDVAVEALVSTMTSKDTEVRSAARTALKRITGEDFGDEATAWQDWVDAGRPGVATDPLSDAIPE
jgi:hypothetical protein